MNGDSSGTRPRVWLVRAAFVWIAALAATGASPTIGRAVATNPFGRGRPVAPGPADPFGAPQAAAPEAAQNRTPSATPRKPVDWVALHPGFAGATNVENVKECAGCHEDSVVAYNQTTHAQIFALTAPAGSGGCELCHGPQSRHLENPDDLSRELTIDPTSPSHSGICLQCHQGGARMTWKSGAHHANQTGCASCHDVHEKKSDRALLLKASVNETCYQCHAEVRGEMGRTSHHPLREGRMDCASCHNAHGSTGSLLIKATVSDTCATCHTEKRGPYVWEHAPVRESCATCHTPHGSNQPKLLATREPFLCLSCHSYGGHINLPRYNRVSSPYGSGCTNCHVTTHGSNHPSGAKFTR